jgi:cysteinyl-tRNA synthetase
MSVRLLNSLGGTRQDFVPLNPPFTGIYVCGPTVYGDSHLGHGKSYVSFDVLVRWLRMRGYRVRYVQNITDVGHLSDNADSGEDKIEKQAELEKLEPMEIAEKYTRSYFEDMDALGNLRPDICPRASGHIPEQIELVRKLIDRGHAYRAGGSVYFSVRSFEGYGKLSGRKPDELLSGARVGVVEHKRDPLDFALWKKAERGHILKWRSPWGWGYPGWHLECSAMAMRYLGETIDIHGGGLENIFPHHESEVAQSEAATGRTFARFWLHNNMITVGGTKMGKSLGNFVTLKQIFGDFDPAVVRLYILRSHYRSPLDFTSDGLESARSAWERLVELRRRAGEPGSGDISSSMSDALEGLHRDFYSSMDDDLDTPGALAALFEFVRRANSMLDAEASDVDRGVIALVLDDLAGNALGLDLGAGRGACDAAGLQALLDALSEVRCSLRRNHMFAEADSMRKALAAAGYSVRDLPDGTSTISRA